jgi:hypothetical protein
VVVALRLLWRVLAVYGWSLLHPSTEIRGRGVIPPKVKLTFETEMGTIMLDIDSYAALSNIEIEAQDNAKRDIFIALGVKAWIGLKKRRRPHLVEKKQTNI